MMKIDDKIDCHTLADGDMDFVSSNNLRSGSESDIGNGSGNDNNHPVHFPFSYICHVIAISMSLTNESSGDDKIEST